MSHLNNIPAPQDALDSLECAAEWLEDAASELSLAAALAGRNTRLAAHTLVLAEAAEAELRAVRAAQRRHASNPDGRVSPIRFARRAA